jgi:hypothetical protein
MNDTRKNTQKIYYTGFFSRDISNGYYIRKQGAREGIGSFHRDLFIHHYCTTTIEFEFEFEFSLFIFFASFAF